MGAEESRGGDDSGEHGGGLRGGRSETWETSRRGRFGGWFKDYHIGGETGRDVGEKIQYNGRHL